MRSVAAGSFQCLSSLGALWRAWLDCRRGKRRQPGMAAFELDADRHLCRLHRVMVRGSYQSAPYRLSIVRDPKTRLIAAPAIRDRIVQTALLNVIAPTIERGFIDQSYACCTGRGTHRAVLEYLKWTRRFRYRLPLDIRHYFASINHNILLELFSHRVRDEDTLALIRNMLCAGGKVYQSSLARSLPEFAKIPVKAGCGLPLGGFLSHWSGGLYLDGLDHYIKRELKIRGYLRYMDDFVLFSDDLKKLEQAAVFIGEWLWQERGLRLKHSNAQVQPTRSPSTFLGFRISRSGIAPGPKAKRRLKQRLRQADAMGGDRLARTLESYRGLLLSL